MSLLEAPDRPQLRRGAIVTAITGAHAGRRLVFDADTDTVDGDLDGTLRTAALDAARDAVEREASGSVDLGDDGLLFVEAVHPAHRLVIVGAVDTAEEVCKLARQLGWRTVVIDPRTKFATAERIPHADQILGSWPQDAFEEVALERADSVIVLTHDAKIDDPALEWAIRARRRLRRRPRLAAHAGPAPGAPASRRACRARTWSASTARSASTSVRTRRPRPRSRSWPR